MVSTVGEDLTRIRTKLHDDGVLWTDAELLRLYNDAYRLLLTTSQAVRRWRCLDIPGRHTYTITFDWEDGLVSGSVRKWSRMLAPGDAQGSTLWEAEHLLGQPPTVSMVGITQEWERAYAGATDTHYRFSFMRDHQRPVALYWHSRRLVPIGVRELDQLYTAWEQQGGMPRFWTTGLGRNRSVELYQIDVDYQQTWQLIGADAGIARALTGDRTYATAIAPDLPKNRFAWTTRGESQAMTESKAQWLTGVGVRITTLSTAAPSRFGMQAWEVQLLNGVTPTTVGERVGTFVWEQGHGAAVLDLALGLVRRITSPDRQYLASGSDLAVTPLLAGRIVDWRSSTDAVLALEVVGPREDLIAAAVPALLPPPMQKYLRYYVLGMALVRPGEGRNPVLAAHYLQRVARGQAMFKRLASVTQQDVVYQRDEFAPSVPRPPRVQLPPEYPEMWR